MKSASPTTDGTFNDVEIDLNKSTVKIDFKGRRSPVETLFGNMPVPLTCVRRARFMSVYGVESHFWSEVAERFLNESGDDMTILFE